MPRRCTAPACRCDTPCERAPVQVYCQRCGKNCGTTDSLDIPEDGLDGFECNDCLNDNDPDMGLDPSEWRQ